DLTRASIRKVQIRQRISVQVLTTNEGMPCERVCVVSRRSAFYFKLMPPRGPRPGWVRVSACRGAAHSIFASTWRIRRHPNISEGFTTEELFFSWFPRSPKFGGSGTSPFLCVSRWPEIQADG